MRKNIILFLLTVLLLPIPPLLTSYYLTEEYFIIPSLIIDYIPRPVTVCVQEEILGHALWAAGKWNEAVKSYSTLNPRTRINGLEIIVNPSTSECFARLELTDTPPSQLEYGGFTLDIDPSTYRIRGAVIYIWRDLLGDERLFRAVLLHEFGHLLGAPDIYPVKTSPYTRRPLMFFVINSKSPVTDITPADIYALAFTWDTRVYCDGRWGCGAFSFRIVNDPMAYLIGAVPPSAAVLLMTYLSDRFSKRTGFNHQLHILRRKKDES